MGGNLELRMSGEPKSKHWHSSFIFAARAIDYKCSVFLFRGTYAPYG